MQATFNSGVSGCWNWVWHQYNILFNCFSFQSICVFPWISIIFIVMIIRQVLEKNLYKAKHFLHSLSATQRNHIISLLQQSPGQRGLIHDEIHQNIDLYVLIILFQDTGESIFLERLFLERLIIFSVLQSECNLVNEKQMLAMVLKKCLRLSILWKWNHTAWPWDKSHRLPC